MDMVKLSIVGGAAVMAALALASTSRQGHAEPSFVELHPPLPTEGIQTRIDEAFGPTESAPIFVSPGSPATFSGVMPSLSGTQQSLALPLVGDAVDAWSSPIDEAARRFGVPADWVRGVMQQESGGRTILNGRPITSSAGAMGLMQVMPATFAELSARYGLGSDPYEPRANIMAGTAYLREMYDRYGPSYFLAAYNAGPGRVDEHLRAGRPLPHETRAYTAALMPALVPGAVPAASPASHGVQDLTSPEAMRSLASSASRSPVPHRTDPASSAVFVSAGAPSTTAPSDAVKQPVDSLFVTLSGTDRRRDVAAAGAGED